MIAADALDECLRRIEAKRNKASDALTDSVKPADEYARGVGEKAGFNQALAIVAAVRREHVEGRDIRQLRRAS